MEGDQERWSGKPLCISTNIIMAHPAPHLQSSSSSWEASYYCQPHPQLHREAES